MDQHTALSREGIEEERREGNKEMKEEERRWRKGREDSTGGKN